MEPKYPSLLNRIKSITIDALIVISGMFLFNEILEKFDTVPNWIRMALFSTLFLYEPLCTAFAATIGNEKMNIRVRKNSDVTQRINLFQAIVRYFFKVVLGWLSFITIFSNKKQRAIHDIISGSVMIEVR